MSKVLGRIRNWWIKAQLKAPPVVQRAVIPRLHETKEIFHLLTKPYLPVRQLKGQGQGGPLTVIYVGLDYTQPFLTDLLFVEEPIEQIVGHIPFWRYDKIAGLSLGDIVIVEAAKHLIHKLPCQNALIFPQMINHVLDVRGDWQDVKSRFRRSVRRHELRLIRKYGYEYDVSHDAKDFERFHSEMYLPTMASRHGELSSPISTDEAYQYFQSGLLFRAIRDGDWVSGMLCYPEQNVLIAKAAGIKNADEQLLHEGATSALYYAGIHWANQNGYDAINFLGSGARLNSGLFQHKRKWGTTVNVPQNLHRLIWIGIRRNTPAVSRFFQENPLITVDQDGNLYGLVTVDDPHNVPAQTKKEWEKHYFTPGLNSLCVRSINGFTKDAGNTNDPDLVIPIPPGPNFENGQ